MPEDIDGAMAAIRALDNEGEASPLGAPVPATTSLLRDRLNQRAKRKQVASCRDLAEAMLGRDLAQSAFGPSESLECGFKPGC